MSDFLTVHFTVSLKSGCHLLLNCFREHNFVLHVQHILTAGHPNWHLFLCIPFSSRERHLFYIWLSIDYYWLSTDWFIFENV